LFNGSLFKTSSLNQALQQAWRLTVTAETVKAGGRNAVKISVTSCWRYRQAGSGSVAVAAKAGGWQRAVGRLTTALQRG